MSTSVQQQGSGGKCCGRQDDGGAKRSQCQGDAWSDGFDGHHAGKGRLTDYFPVWHAAVDVQHETTDRPHDLDAVQSARKKFWGACSVDKSGFALIAAGAAHGVDPLHNDTAVHSANSSSCQKRGNKQVLAARLQDRILFRCCKDTVFPGGACIGNNPSEKTAGHLLRLHDRDQHVHNGDASQ